MTPQDNSDATNSDATINTMQQQFDIMRTASRQDQYVDWSIRSAWLKKLEQLVMDNQSEIITAIHADFGQRPAAETTMLELFPTLEAIRYTQKHGKAWSAKQPVKTGIWFLPARSYIQPQPLGLVGIIAPWNYPLYLVIAPLAAALVAGNRAMLKVSEASPNFEQWLADALPKYFAADEVTLITGDVEVAQAFSQLPFDHLFFTGSTAVGKHIMKAAAQNLTPVTLELGGKSPVVVTPSADVAKTVNRVWTGKTMNAGQTCIAPDYVLMENDKKHAFIEQSTAWLDAHYPNLADNPDYSFIINPKQASRVQGYLDEAKQRGATLIPLTDYEVNIETGFFPPIIVTDVPSDAKLLTEEIFAPVLPLVSYQDLTQAVAYVNERDRPLALYVFGEDKADTDYVLAHTVSGGACVNETIFHIAQQNLPFGGVGASGMGRYHGKYSFDTFSHPKAVFKQSHLNFAHLLQPPYGKTFWNMMKVILKA